MKKVVLDASVIIKWFNQEKGREAALDYLKKLQLGKVRIFLPELVKYELANALLKGKKPSFNSAGRILKIFYQLPLNFVTEDSQLANNSYKLAEKLKITYYDASFLALAKKVNGLLITANPRHQKKIRGVKVEAI